LTMNCSGFSSRGKHWEEKNSLFGKPKGGKPEEREEVRAAALTVWSAGAKGKARGKLGARDRRVAEKKIETW